MKSKWWKRSTTGRAFHLNIYPVGQAILVEIVVARCLHDSLFRKHRTLKFWSIDWVFIFEDVDEADGALEILIVVGGLEFEVVVVIVGLEESWNEESRPYFILQD